MTVRSAAPNETQYDCENYHDYRNQPPSHRMPWSPSCAEMLVKGHMTTAGMVGDGDGVDVGEHEIALEHFARLAQAY